MVSGEVVLTSAAQPKGPRQCWPRRRAAQLCHPQPTQGGGDGAGTGAGAAFRYTLPLPLAGAADACRRTVVTVLSSPNILFMDVFIFGASGFIGQAVTRQVIAAGHSVSALARSDRSSAALLALGARPVRGDMTEPSSWQDSVAQADAIVQVAAAFEGDLATADAIWTDAIIRTAQQQSSRALRVIYTGGCWLYPARTEPALTEADAFDPLPSFQFMVAHRAKLIAAGVETVIVHPGMVWSEDGGCTGEIASAIRVGKAVDVVDSTAVCWPLVHVEDLASLYALALAKGEAGCDYLGVADPGISVARIIHAIEHATGRTATVRTHALAEAVEQHGEWIMGTARSQCIDSDRARLLLGWRPQRAFLDSMTASVGERAARPGPAEALYRVTADWTATYPDPICLQRGDAFSLSDETFDWDGHTWIWARSEDGREGWIPDDLARRSEGVLRAQEAFSAMELSCRAGEQLHGLKQRHGWVWCRHPDGRTGWVPHGYLEKVPPPAT